MRRSFLTLAVVLLASAGGVQAGDFPEHTVRLVVPFPAGGSTDVLARLVSLRLAEQWGHPVVVTNVPGNSSVLGTQTVASAPPDGHTLLVANAALAINEALSRDLPYHALRSFAPISLLAGQPLVLAVNGSSPLRSVEQLIVMARNSPAALPYGAAGAGSLSHLAGELLRLMTFANVVHVPHANPRSVLDELMANRLTYAIVALPPTLPHVKDGKVRALAVAGQNRATALPDVPTIGASVTGYAVSTWIGLLAPHGPSVKLLRKLNADVQTVMRRPDLVEQIGSLGYDPRGSSPGDFENRLRGDIERYSRVVFDAGIARPGRTTPLVGTESDMVRTRSSGTQ